MPSYYRLQRTWNEVLRYTPLPARRRLRKAASLIGLLESISIRRNDMIPPLRKRIQVGRGNWNRIGEEFVRAFVELAGVEPDHRILEVGCGFGRIAARLVAFMNKRGTYDGFDVVPEAVDWCRRRIESRFPNFHFQVSDVYNGMYNPTGKHAPSEFRFPYDDVSFDFVCLTSVFTHMLPGDLENYFREISRILETGGRCLITYFLLNAESMRLVDSEESVLDFRGVYKDCRVLDLGCPEGGIAYDEKYIRRLYGHHGLEVVEPIHWGLWCGRSRFRSYQDIVVARKRG